MPTDPIDLGAPPAMRNARLKFYAGAVERAFELAGWDLGEFTGYRAEMDYPPAPCELTMTCEIGAR